jgi:hypothetical protein
VNRELIYQALFDTLSGIPGIVTASRRLQHWTDVPETSQPALFQSQKSEHQIPRKGFPAKVILQCEIYLYVNSGNDLSVAPSPQMNSFMDAIEAALAPAVADGFQTLNGTVSHCWIEGEVITDEGNLGPQAISIIPVNILINH